MDGKTLKQLGNLKDEVQFLRSENDHLRSDLNYYRSHVWRAHQSIHQLQEQMDQLNRQNDRLKQRVADLTEQLDQKPLPTVPSFVTPNTPHTNTKKKPGRKAGHPVT